MVRFMFLNFYEPPSHIVFVIFETFGNIVPISFNAAPPPKVPQIAETMSHRFRVNTQLEVS